MKRRVACAAMRSLRWMAVLLVSALLAGCTDDGDGLDDHDDHDDGGPDGARGEDGSASIEPIQHAFDVSVLVGVAALGESDPARASWTFQVPEGASVLVGGGQWACVTMCPLEVSLVDPFGEHAFHDTVWGWDAEIDDPAPGAWTLAIATGMELTVGDDGELTVTIE